MKHVLSEISSNGTPSRRQPRLDPKPHVSPRALRGQGFTTQAASTLMTTDTKDAAGMMLSTRELRPFKLEVQTDLVRGFKAQGFAILITKHRTG